MEGHDLDQHAVPGGQWEAGRVDESLFASPQWKGYAFEVQYAARKWFKKLR